MVNSAGITDITALLAFNKPGNGLVVARMEPGRDLFEGLQIICRQFNTGTAVVVGAVGSLRRAAFMCAVKNDTCPMGIGYSEVQLLEGPVELLCAQGLVTQGLEGDLKIHLHGSFCDQNGRVYGGHLTPGNEVLITMEVSLLILKGTRLIRRFDPEIKFERLYMSCF